MSQRRACTRNSGDLKSTLHCCEICNKDFTEQSYLVRHIRVHIKEKRYSCELCNKIFPKKSLIRHRRVHTNEKPYSCKICSKAFSQTSHVVGHMRHTGGHSPREATQCQLTGAPSALVCIME
ncbi:zinc finger protein 468-like [Penaeus monodon]|uniref:zinc finger protein 468-like n=1 Tax=Penaeus monodon TaxID=6687 RepID=UPI0018A79513|nr:zinc finger protein 468-like [Penaeus monodon]